MQKTAKNVSERPEKTEKRKYIRHKKPVTAEITTENKDLTWVVKRKQYEFMPYNYQHSSESGADNSIIRTLNDFGKQGWHPIFIQRFSTIEFYFILQREKI